MIPGDRDESAGAGGPTGADPGSDLRFSPRPNRAHEIAWRAWGDEAFDEARRAGKPVLLAISAVWCHWCHVMDETTYSDPRVLSAIAEGYVAVRVDNDRRPDLNRRYNMGGWPTVAFLTPDGEVLTGATYLPPDRLLAVLERVREYYAQHADELTGAAAGGAVAPPPPPGRTPTPTSGRPPTRCAAPWRRSTIRSTAASARSPSSRSPTRSACCWPPESAAATGVCWTWPCTHSTPWRPARCATRSSTGSFATRPGATGRRPTTRSCSTTTPASPCSTSTPTPSPGGRPTRRSRATSSTT